MSVFCSPQSRISSFALLCIALPLSLAALVAPAAPVGAASSSTPMAAAWIANGTVYAMERVDTTLYIGGDFTHIGKPGGSFAVFDADDAEAQLPWGLVNGTVDAVIDDGAGGWYIGGAFTRVGDTPRSNLAHILADGSLDPNWHPASDGIIFALLLLDDTLYVGGYYTAIDGVSRGSLAAIDAATGAVLPWETDFENGPYADIIWSLVSDGTTIYVGGQFRTIAGLDRTNLAAIDAATGTVTDWAPNPNTWVRELLLNDSTLYVGGSFTTIGSVNRAGLAAFDTTTGLITSWNPEAPYFSTALS